MMVNKPKGIECLCDACVVWATRGPAFDKLLFVLFGQLIVQRCLWLFGRRGSNESIKRSDRVPGALLDSVSGRAAHGVGVGVLVLVRGNLWICLPAVGTNGRLKVKECQ
mmetsp:Transcript_5195/g.10857  ORF Transcript_5195/g.10857 Transcript_5195/m.10857 type:complete len:109 (+) Transcript_5195:300-626(+)